MVHSCPTDLYKKLLDTEPCTMYINKVGCTAVCHTVTGHIAYKKLRLLDSLPSLWRVHLLDFTCTYTVIQCRPMARIAW